MDDSLVVHSEYLQSRLHDRGSRLQYYHDNHGPAGRDDGIFDIEPEYQPNRRLSGRRNGPLLAGPPTSYHHDDITQSRRASGVSTSSQPRTMGAREMEGHVDKLSKQNFDLKLEVYHRREKIEELEKKLQAVPQLEEDNAELVEVNSDLLWELERRDRAVDEAVMLICDLEEKVRRLEEQLVQTRPSTAQPTTVSTNSSGARVSPSMHRGGGIDSPSSLEEKKLAPTSGDSFNVSARLAELASPQRSAGKPKLMPSFLSKHEPSTDALRQLFVEGNQKLRPVPSYATFMSSQTGKDDDGAIDDALYSPKLSALSDSDLRSLYGNHPSPAPFGSCSRESYHADSNAFESTSSTTLSQKRRLARTNRWVSARAVSPTKIDQRSRTFSSDVGQFRSLEDVLYQENGGDGLDFPTKDMTEGVIASHVVDNKITPQTTNPPYFGPNMYPPTPDTMVTRPLNHSTSSIIPGKSLLDGTPAPQGNFSSMIPMVQPAHLGRLPAHSNFGSRAIMFSNNFDAYADSASSDGEHESGQADAYFGLSSFQMDGSLDQKSSKKHCRDQSSLTGSTMIGADSQQDLKATGFIRNSPSPPPLISHRTRSTHIPTQNASSSRPIPFLPSVSSYMYSPDKSPLSNYSAGTRTPTGTTNQQSDHNRELSCPSTVLDQPASNPHIHSYKKANDPQAQTVVAPPTSTQFEGNSKPISTPNIPRRAASLRARVANLGRRTSTSTSNSAYDSTAAPLQRSESVTHRLFRRGISNRDEALSPPFYHQQNSIPTEHDHNSEHAPAPFPTTTTTITPTPISPPQRSNSFTQSPISAPPLHRSLDRAPSRNVYSPLSMSAHWAASGSGRDSGRSRGRTFTPSIAASDDADDANDSTVVVRRTPVPYSNGRPSVRGRHSSWRSGESVEVVAYKGREKEIEKESLGRRVRRSFSRSREAG